MPVFDASRAGRYVICYDIANDRRRRRLADTLDDFGTRVQDSVFEAVLDRALLDKCIRAIGKNLHPGEDRLSVYPLCAACERRRIDLGLAARDAPPGPARVVIV
jgi:CRISPR-associated protein Cas2